MRGAAPSPLLVVLAPAALALAVSTGGCSDDDADGAPSSADPEGSGQTTGGEPGDRDDEGEGGVDAEPDAGEPEPRGEKLKVLIKESRLLGNVPAKHRTPELHARLEEDRIAVLIEHLDADCGPVPRFEARLLEGVVEVRMLPAEEDTGCVGPHDVKLRIDPPSEPPKRLRIVDPEGQQIVAGD